MPPAQTQIEALQRLWAIANGHSGRAGTVARFLLGLYNGQRFPFDLSEFRKLDVATFEDCLQALQMDCRPHQEVHGVLGVGSEEFEWLALSWGLDDSQDGRDSFIQ